MQTEPIDYEITLYPRGPASCEWKLWPKNGGPAAGKGVARNQLEAQKAAQKAKDKLLAKKP